MGKKIIIKGADFSANGIKGSTISAQVYQGLLNSATEGAIGAVEPTNAPLYGKRVFINKTITVPSGVTVHFREASDLNVHVGGLLVYSQEITFPAATGERNTEYVEDCISGTAYTSVTTALNSYTYTNNSDSTVYISLTLKESSNATISPSDIGEIDVIM